MINGDDSKRDRRGGDEIQHDDYRIETETLYKQRVTHPVRRMTHQTFCRAERLLIRSGLKHKAVPVSLGNPRQINNEL